MATPYALTRFWPEREIGRKRLWVVRLWILLGAFSTFMGGSVVGLAGVLGATVAIVSFYIGALRALSTRSGAESGGEPDGAE